MEVGQNFFVLIPVSLFREFQREEGEGDSADGLAYPFLIPPGQVPRGARWNECCPQVR